MINAEHKADTKTRPLKHAIIAASLAPSIFNTQPWLWRINHDIAELRVDRSRQLKVVDPDGRLMTVSCGGALQHALVALAAEGYTVEVERFPDERYPDLLARVHLREQGPITPIAKRQYQSLLIRHTDRRPFADEPVSESALTALQNAAESQGGHLQILRRDQVVTLISAVSRAEDIEMADPAYRAELAQWTNRSEDAEDGVPAGTAVGPAPRKVPVREFTVDAQGVQPNAAPGDMHARYALLSTNGDSPADWLMAGESLSAVFMAAVEADLAVSPMSDVTEVLSSREQLRGLLGGIGYPQIALRIGIAGQVDPAPATGRRDAESIIDTTSEETRS